MSLAFMLSKEGGFRYPIYITFACKMIEHLHLKILLAQHGFWYSFLVFCSAAKKSQYTQCCNFFSFSLRFQWILQVPRYLYKIMVL